MESHTPNNQFIPNTRAPPNVKEERAANVTARTAVAADPVMKAAAAAAAAAIFAAIEDDDESQNYN